LSNKKELCKIISSELLQERIYKRGIRLDEKITKIITKNPKKYKKDPKHYKIHPKNGNKRPHNHFWVPFEIFGVFFVFI